MLEAAAAGFIELKNKFYISMIANHNCPDFVAAL